MKNCIHQVELIGHNCTMETITPTQNSNNVAEVGDILSNRYRVLNIITASELTEIYLTEDISLFKDNVCLLKRYKYDGKQAHLFKANKRLFETELNYLRLFKDYEKIPKLLDHFEDDNYLSLIQEVIEGELVIKTLPLNVNSPNIWLELNVLEFLRDTLEILEHLNQQDIVHSNINPSNLIQKKEDNHFCLIDFANAQKITDLDNPFKKLLPFQYANVVHPTGYIAPEQVIGQTKINSDLYSLGIISIQALTGIDINKLELSQKNNELNWQEIWGASDDNGHGFLISEEVLSILNKLVAYDYKDRYTNATKALKNVQNLINKKNAQIIIFTEEQWPGLGFSPNYYFSSISNQKNDDNDRDKLIHDEIINEDDSRVSIADNLITENIDFAEDFSEILQEYPEEKEEISKSHGLKIDKTWLSIIGGIGITGLLIYAGVIYFGLSTILEVLGLDSGGKQLLKAQEAYNSGNIEEAIAIAQDIPSSNQTYKESQTVLKQWETEWNSANENLEKIEAAFEAKQWETVLQDAIHIPQNPLWQEKLTPLVKVAKENVDIEARKILQQAINHAEAQEFSEALYYLKQIPLQSSFGELVKTKLVEYEEKRDVRAYYNLQEAFNAAQKRDFVTAINFLEKIPPDSSKYEIAQQKIIEYNQMQNIKQTMEQRNLSYSPVSNFNPGKLLNEIHI